MCQESRWFVVTVQKEVFLKPDFVFRAILLHLGDVAVKAHLQKIGILKGMPNYRLFYLF